jgi:hypothetical protein
MHLGGNINNIGSEHVSTTNVSVSFAPPKLTEDNTSSKAITVGLIQDLSLNQQRNITKFFEYGNDEYQMVTGKPRINASFNRILFDGPSLLKYIGYAYKDTNMLDHKYQGMYESMMQSLANDLDASKINDSKMPGTGDFWVNLTSELFDNPIGIFINIKQRMPNGYLQDYGGVFLENCLISSHVLQMNASNRVLTENMQMEVGRPVPLGKYTGDKILRIEQVLKERF